MTSAKQYANDIDPVLGYTPGTVIRDEVEEYRCVRAAHQVMLHRYREYGIEGIHNLMGLVDDCTVPDFFEGPAYQERYLGNVLMEEEVTTLARRHMGGGEGYTALVFNRVTAGTVTVMQALVPPGSIVPYVVPPYPGLGGHGHPSVPRAVDLARSRCVEVTSVSALESLLDSESQVPVVVVCSYYRGVLKEDELREFFSVAHAHGIPVYVDDASGARTRTAVYGQPSAGELGADLIITSCEKAALFGPRAGLLLGRSGLMGRIGARAEMLGTEARPSVVAGVVQALREYTPERGRQLFDGWLERNRRLWELAKPYLGEKLRYGAYDGIYLTLDDFMQLVMEKAGIDETDLAPVDLSVACAMLMLRGHGFLTVAPLHYPGASKLVSVKVNALRQGDDISDKAIVEGLADSVDALVCMLTDRATLEKVLFGPPD